jgi:hypothetical protein
MSVMFGTIRRCAGVRREPTRQLAAEVLLPRTAGQAPAGTALRYLHVCLLGPVVAEGVNAVVRTDAEAGGDDSCELDDAAAVVIELGDGPRVGAGLGQRMGTGCQRGGRFSESLTKYRSTSLLRRAARASGNSLGNPTRPLLPSAWDMGNPSREGTIHHQGTKSNQHVRFHGGIPTHSLFSYSQPGGRPPTRGEITANARAGARFAIDRDLPDPVGWQDLAASSTELFEVVERRLAAGRYPGHARPFPLPKPGKGTVRWLSDLDPVDEVITRALVGRAIGAASNRVDRSVVFGTEVAGKPPGWFIADHRPQQRRRRERGLELLTEKDCVGLLTLDVQDFYPSVATDELGPAMVGWGAPEGAVVILARVLRAWQAAGLSGLPTGFEGSAPLATALLAPADAALVRARVGLVRWMDDTWAFLTCRDDPDAVAARYAEALLPLRLRLNDSKTQLWDRDMAEFVIRDAFLDSLTRGSTERLDVDQALELLDSALDPLIGEVLWPWVRFGLGALRAEQDPGGLPALQEHPELFEQEPKVVSDYIVGVARGRHRRKISQEWLLEEATGGSCPSTLARRVHACRAISAVRGSSKAMSAGLRRAIEDDQLPVALRAWSAVAWARSQGWKASTAAELALDGTDEFSLRRALVAGFAFQGAFRSGANSNVHDKLLEVEPDLSPTLAWATSRK